MLIHIVVWKYKEETTRQERDEHVAMLSALPGKIDEIVEFKVGTDILHLDRSYDTGLSSSFKNREDLDAYTVHPAHQEVAAMGKRIAAGVVSVDFISKD